MLVDVQKRTGPGINKPGGVGRVTACFAATADAPERYNIKYVLGGSEKNVSVQFIDPQIQLDGARKRSSAVDKDGAVSRHGRQGKNKDAVVKSTKEKNNTVRTKKESLFKCNSVTEGDSLIGMILVLPDHSGSGSCRSDNDISIETRTQICPMNDDDCYSNDRQGRTPKSSNEQTLLENFENSNKIKNEVTTKVVKPKMVTQIKRRIGQKKLNKSKSDDGNITQTQPLSVKSKNQIVPETLRVSNKGKDEAATNKHKKTSKKAQVNKSTKQDETKQRKALSLVNRSKESDIAGAQKSKQSGNKRKNIEHKVHDSSSKKKEVKSTLKTSSQCLVSDCNTESSSMNGTINSNRFSAFTALSNTIFCNGRDVVNLHDLHNFVNKEGSENFSKRETISFLKALDRGNLIMFDQNAEMIYMI